MFDKPFSIKRKQENLRGEDGSKVISLRIKETTLEKIDTLAQEANRSRNEIMNLILEYAVNHVKIED